MKRVVVTGIGAVTPIGNNAKIFWENAKNGVNGIAPITKFDTSELKAKLAAELKDFDINEYLEKGESRKMDPFVQYAMVATDEALKDSGILGTVAPERFGVYYGSGIGGFETFCEEDAKLIEKGPKRVSPHFIPKLIGNIAAGNIAIKYEAKGPCVAMVTACATGTTNIGEAYRAIKHGYADAMIAGGSEASITPLAVAGFVNCMALHTGEDPAKASIPFDKNRSGFIMGEGAGTLILEEYEHAVARGAKIYAEVCGYGSTCDAYHVTAPAPDASGAAAAIKQAITEAEMAEETDVYINAHGTSTPLNDKTETLAIKAAYGEENAKKVSISSTKSMTGHMLGAAGAVEAIAAVLALKENIVPPTIGYSEPDEDCDLDYTPNTAKKRDLKAALSVSLGFGGHNACVMFKK
ncbi:MAG: beta-ketoacyl-[acyl-carrier-protein] synthase II [Ruminococcaceae bacterium]|nr:beta-ketoacyl-[acyl-carrier-protein] synthase II [Oscillospiraceae bacterium]